MEPDTKLDSGDPEQQLRIDLLNAFYSAFKAGMDRDEVMEHVEETKEMAYEDAQ